MLVIGQLTCHACTSGQYMSSAVVVHFAELLIFLMEMFH